MLDKYTSKPSSGFGADFDKQPFGKKSSGWGCCRHSCHRSFADSQKKFAAELISIMRQEESKERKEQERQNSEKLGNSSSSQPKNLMKKISTIFKI
ncbi:unnamed protein product, partial [Mesorhabditis spiculigera]